MFGLAKSASEMMRSLIFSLIDPIAFNFLIRKASLQSGAFCIVRIVDFAGIEPVSLDWRDQYPTVRRKAHYTNYVNVTNKD